MGQGGGALRATLVDLLPTTVAVVADDGRRRVPDLAELTVGERLVVARAGPRRLEDFVAGRACAHRALRVLGYDGAEVLAGAGRQPLWPAGVVGSITHCEGYVAAAVARASAVRSLGIDAEVLAPAGADVRRVVMAPGEAPLDVGDGIDPVLLAFSAKEAAFKAWYPLTQWWLEPRQAQVRVEGDSFTVTVLDGAVPPASGDDTPQVLAGRWTASQTHLLCAVVVPAAGT